MAPTKYLARGCEFQIEDVNNPGTYFAFRTQTGGSGEGGINTFTVSSEYESADITTFGSAGRAETWNVQEGVSITLEGFRLQDQSTGALDAAMAAAEAQAARLGPDSHLGFRYVTGPADTNWRVWENATFQLGDQGGGNNDPNSWSVTITRSGPTTSAVKS